MIGEQQVNNMNAAARALWEARVTANLSTVDVAKEVGLSPPTLYRFYLNEHVPKLATIEKMVNFLKSQNDYNGMMAVKSYTLKSVGLDV